MASIRHSSSVASAVCKQTANSRPLAQSVASVQTCRPVSLFSPTRYASFSILQLKSPSTMNQARMFLTHVRRQAQAFREPPITRSTSTLPKGAKSQPALQLTNLPYFVRRTGSNQLPVYVVTKAGGTKQLTKIQKTEGDLDALRNDLALTLGVDVRSSDVSVNRLTGHIIVKGWRKPEIVDFLKERNF
ncbi:Phosphopantothenoylcysteine decarboxylase [Penicillium taxi]|uniref:Phosphopantothenoylcysteine decarboxylase n=1 Tax=Penicillium taxi TaxID=168475 RepID=UPI0025452E2B|nr:Phosphopantothenoylcysteine decarboxylase [Penicillium taxi]KAJ5888028.1 Phosphopantothenoylcysteine decarboxylase [Penicillium taxi]